MERDVDEWQGPSGGGTGTGPRIASLDEPVTLRSFTDGLVADDVPLVRPTTAPRLTERELEILKLLADDHGTGQIALLLGVSERTVRSHVASACGKFGVTTRCAAVAQAFRLDVLE